MNYSRNRVQLIGRVGKNPEIVNLDSGKKLAKFSLATSDYYHNANGDRIETTEWHNGVFWHRLETIEKHLLKGNEIALEGKLTHRSWEDSQGKKHYITEIIGSDFMFLSSNKPVNAES